MDIRERGLVRQCAAKTSSGVSVLVGQERLKGLQTQPQEGSTLS